MRYFCVFFISHLVSSASLFPPWVQPTCWWRFFVFSHLQPALVTRFDLTYPGVTAANYLASLWSLFWMSFSPSRYFVVVVVVVVVFVVVVHPYSGTWRLCRCSDAVMTSAWNSSEGLNNRLLGLQTEPPFEESHLCSEITFIFSKYGWSKWNQFMWCSSFWLFYLWCLFCGKYVIQNDCCWYFDDVYCIWVT